MNDPKYMITSALSSIVALGMLGASPEASAAPKNEMEKCYGVAKAGQNDCKTMSSACAGHSVQDRQKDAFIALPKGTCERIAGGSVQQPRAEAK